MVTLILALFWLWETSQSDYWVFCSCHGCLYCNSSALAAGSRDDSPGKFFLFYHASNTKCYKFLKMPSFQAYQGALTVVLRQVFINVQLFFVCFRHLFPYNGHVPYDSQNYLLNDRLCLIFNPLSSSFSKYSLLLTISPFFVWVLQVFWRWPCH